MPTNKYSICPGVRWIDILDPSPGEMHALSEEFRLNEHVIQDSLQPEHLPKYEQVEDVHFLILRFYANTPAGKPDSIQDLSNKIALFFTDAFLITVHKYEAPFLNGIREKQVKPGKCRSVADVLIHIVWQTLQTFEEPANRLSDALDRHENEVLHRKTGKGQMESLYKIKRQASISHKILLLQGEPVNHIPAGADHASALQDVRDQHLKVQTLYHQVLEDVNNLMNLSLSFAGQRTNDVMKLLTIFSAFFLPLTFIAGIYGMNFKHMPELEQPWGYPAALILMVVITIGIFYWFRKKRWL